VDAGQLREFFAERIGEMVEGLSLDAEDVREALTGAVAAVLGDEDAPSTDAAALDEQLAEATDAYSGAAAHLETLLVAAIAERVRRTHETAAVIEVAWTADGDSGSGHPYVDVVGVCDAEGDALALDGEEGVDMLWDITSYVRMLGDVEPGLKLRDVTRYALDPAASGD
jgi:hypothetical protein